MNGGYSGGGGGLQVPPPKPTPHPPKNEALWTVSHHRRAREIHGLYY